MQYQSPNNNIRLCARSILSYCTTGSAEMSGFVNRIAIGQQIIVIYFLLLLSVFLTGCGGGGGGGGGNDTSITTTAVIGSSGGEISLSDGVIVSIDSGILNDRTSITVVSNSQPASTSSDVVPLSYEVTLTFPSSGYSNSPSDPSDGISLKLPLIDTNAASVSLNTTTTSRSVTEPTSYQYLRTTFGSTSDSFSLYGSPVIEGGSANAKIPSYVIDGILDTTKANTTASIIVEKSRFTLPTARMLFEVRDGSMSEASFINTLSPSHTATPAEKIPLILIHGIGFRCDNSSQSYKDTWREFIKYFYSNTHISSSELREKYQLYTYSYQTELGINNNGEALALKIQETFGARPVVILAHSMGGLVARAAIVNWTNIGANIEGLITLGTPHHGTFVFSETAGVIDAISCMSAAGAQGALDLRWDNFNKPGICSNEFLLCGENGINAHDDNQYKYITYAGDMLADPFICLKPSSNRFCVASGILLYYGNPLLFGINNDGLVPVSSATFATYDGAELFNIGKNEKLRRDSGERVFPGIQHSSIHDSHRIFHGDDNHAIYATPNITQDLLDFYDSITPPSISSVNILNNTTNVPISSEIIVTFSETIDPSTINESSFTLTGPGGFVSGIVTYNSGTHAAILSPTENLAFNTSYTATVNTGIKDNAGNSLSSNYSWIFTTESEESQVGGTDGRVAFVRTASIYTINPDGSDEKQLNNLPIYLHPSFEPKWSPDGTHILYLYSFDYETWVIDINSGEEKLVTDISDVGSMPSWSYDGKKIVLLVRDSLGFNIYSINPDGTELKQLTLNGASFAPMPSPVNNKIAFVGFGTGRQQIYVINVDGTNLTQLTNNFSVVDTDPVWAPDGSQIVFFRQGVLSINYNLYKMNADGSNQHQILINGSGFDLNTISKPVWSPDGTRLAFTAFADSNNNRNVFVMNADGSNVSQLTTSNGIDPVWSQDSSRIAYKSGTKIYIMNADGSDQHVLTDGSVPVWSPAARVESPPTPDLTVQNINYSPSSVAPGGTVAVSWTLVNQGAATAAASNTAVRINQSTSSAAGTNLVTVVAGSLGATQSVSQNANVTVPTTAGTYRIWVIADNNSTSGQTGSAADNDIVLASGTLTVASAGSGSGDGILNVANAPAPVGGTFVSNGNVTDPQILANTAVIGWEEDLELNGMHLELLQVNFDTTTEQVFAVRFITSDFGSVVEYSCILSINPCVGASINKSTGRLTLGSTVLDTIPLSGASVTLSGALTFSPF